MPQTLQDNDQEVVLQSKEYNFMTAWGVLACMQAWEQQQR
jgi:hypothetical protein